MKPLERDSLTQKGFTLVEVVLAISIFALMATILYGAFFLGQRALEKADVGFEKNQELRAFASLLESYVRSSYPYRVSAQDATIYYEGGQERLTFISAYSMALGGRGMAKISISWEPTRGGEGILKLSEELPVRVESNIGQAGQRNTVILHERLREFRLGYLDPQGEDKWEDRWDSKERQGLPRAVRLSYRNGANQYVRWTFPVMMNVLAP